MGKKKEKLKPKKASEPVHLKKVLPWKHVDLIDQAIELNLEKAFLRNKRNKIYISGAFYWVVNAVIDYIYVEIEKSKNIITFPGEKNIIVSLAVLATIALFHDKKSVRDVVNQDFNILTSYNEQELESYIKKISSENISYKSLNNIIYSLMFLAMLFFLFFAYRAFYRGDVENTIALIIPGIPVMALFLNVGGLKTLFYEELAIHPKAIEKSLRAKQDELAALLDEESKLNEFIEMKLAESAVSKQSLFQKKNIVLTVKPYNHRLSAKKVSKELCYVLGLAGILAYPNNAGKTVDVTIMTASTFSQPSTSISMSAFPSILKQRLQIQDSIGSAQKNIAEIRAALDHQFPSTRGCEWSYVNGADYHLNLCFAFFFENTQDAYEKLKAFFAEAKPEQLSIQQDSSEDACIIILCKDMRRMIEYLEPVFFEMKQTKLSKKVPEERSLLDSDIHEKRLPERVQGTSVSKDPSSGSSRSGNAYFFKPPEAKPIGIPLASTEGIRVRIYKDKHRLFHFSSHTLAEMRHSLNDDKIFDKMCRVLNKKNCIPQNSRGEEGIKVGQYSDKKVDKFFVRLKPKGFGGSKRPEFIESEIKKENGLTIYEMSFHGIKSK